MNDRLLVAVHEKKALVKPIGRATFKQAPALRRFGISVISKGCRALYLEMSACTSLDSTFMGVLAGIAMWPLPEGEKMDVVLTGLSPRTHSMLSSLGLERILTCREDVASGEDFLGVLAVDQDMDQRETLDTMQKAHQDLVLADAENATRFCDVLTYLDQEIKKAED